MSFEWKVRRMENKIRGMILCATLGDALGAPHELRYHDPPSSFDGRLKRTLFFNRYRNTKKYRVAGQYTDDGEMTITLARSMAHNKGYMRDRVLQSYLEWGTERYSNCMGYNTRALLTVKKITSYRNRFDKRFPDEASKERCQSNGAMMRCSPLAAISDYFRRQEAVIEDCSLTNPSSIAIEVNKLYVEILRSCMNDESPEVTIINAQADTDCVPLDTFDDERDVTVHKGWCLHSFHCVIQTLKHLSREDDPFQILSSIIRRGGDTDTNACICGAVIGAFFGYEKLRKHSTIAPLIDQMENADWTQGDFPQPDKYQLKDMEGVFQVLSKL